MESSVPPIEIGSLTAVSPNESQFIGSSSGIFFVNTVRRAFATSKVKPPGAFSQPEVEGAETYIGGVDPDDNRQENEASDYHAPNNRSALAQTRDYEVGLLSQLPSREHAGKLIQVYFRVWHPLFPFLHGPTFLKELEIYYTYRQGNYQPSDETERRKLCCCAIIFQSIFNLVALDRPDLCLHPDCAIKSATALTTLLCSLATRHDILVMQALLAGQLYLIATMSLHAASTVGGVLLRMILHGGLHRCPCRYPQISPHDADMRKRIFWSFYVVDRHLSQALGLPLGIQDSDNDVCVPGSAELHRPVQTHASDGKEATTEIALHLPEGHPAFTKPRSKESSTLNETVRSPRHRSTSTVGSAQPPDRNLLQESEKRPGQEVLAHSVAYARLTGRALEMLHKSLTFRSVEYNHVLELTSDIHSFWNSLPKHLQDFPNRDPTPTPNSNDENQNQSLLSLFFSVNYQQLILLVNRPFLSLKPTSLEFRLSLQTCITASRTVINTLGSCQSYVSWPGMLSVTWMAGLILAFACALDLYPVEKGFPEIRTCLRLLKEMSSSSETAKHCHSALNTLLNDLSSSHYGDNLDIFTTSLPNLSASSSHNKSKRSFPSDQAHSQPPHPHHQHATTSKRQRVEDIPNTEQSHSQSPSQPQPQPHEPTTKDSNNPNQTTFDPNTTDSTSQNFWIPPPNFDDNGVIGDQLSAWQDYEQDIFGHLTFENLLQYNDGSEGFGFGFGAEDWGFWGRMGMGMTSWGLEKNCT